MEKMFAVIFFGGSLFLHIAGKITKVRKENLLLLKFSSCRILPIFVAN